ncbi:MAG: Asp-tRNA(Asn)/Glu-tRNA(Gln) amidotransferase subunit GatC [Ktedonobacterales bacterium]|nr:Asp-tRNA(Asn)/Glu-tRNA(Gln) amidotransferase subunit GatC [Ktedonobacterales bacterium]
MSISREEVQHIALLARLRLTDEEAERMRAQLSAILGHIAVLQEADVSDVPPSVSILPPIETFRADEAAPSLPPDELLANAPEREEDYLRVKAVLE